MLRYLDGPITPHLLRLVPGDQDSIEMFVGKLGWWDLALWARSAFLDSDAARDLWDETRTVPGEGEDEVRRLFERIMAAWVHQDSIAKFSLSRGNLKIAWSAAARDDWSQEKRLDWMSGFYRNPALFFNPASSAPGNLQALRLGLEARGDPPRLAFVPADIFSRSYFELAQLLGRRQLKPAVCVQCAQWFPPNRDGQRFCPGSSCKRDHDAAYSKHPYRKEYMKMYGRYRRGTMSRREWDEWRDRNPGPDAWKGANPDGLDSQD